MVIENSTVERIENKETFFTISGNRKDKYMQGMAKNTNAE